MTIEDRLTALALAFEQSLAGEASQTGPDRFDGNGALLGDPVQLGADHATVAVGQPQHHEPCRHPAIGGVHDR